MQAAFFDLDKTIIARSSGLMFGRDLYREGFISKRLLLRGIAAQFVYLLVGADEDKMEKMRGQVLAITKGWDQAKIREIVEEVMGDVITPVIYKEALELIREHQEAGRKVVIVSSSPEEIVIPLGHLLEVDEVIATRGCIDEEGRYTGELDFYCYGQGKVDEIKRMAAEEGIDLAGSYAYSDSVTDIPMLEAVGNPVVVNPDRALSRHASAAGWPVVHFEKPVTIRRRIADFAPSKRASVTGGVALSIFAAAGYIWVKRRGNLKFFASGTVNR